MAEVEVAQPAHAAEGVLVHLREVVVVEVDLQEVMFGGVLEKVSPEVSESDSREGEGGEAGEASETAVGTHEGAPLVAVVHNQGSEALELLERLRRERHDATLLEVQAKESAGEGRPGGLERRHGLAEERLAANHVQARHLLRRGPEALGVEKALERQDILRVHDQGVRVSDLELAAVEAVRGSVSARHEAQRDHDDEERACVSQHGYVVSLVQAAS